MDARHLSNSKALFDLFQHEDNIKEATPNNDQNLLTQMENDEFFVLAAYDNEKLVGGLTAFLLKMYKHNRNKMLLYEMGVKASFRRQGIGTKLFDELITLSKESNVHKIIILTEEINKNAISFYQKNGARLEIDGRILIRPCL